MPTIDIVRESPCVASFRVQQLQGIFDLPVKSKLRHEWHINLPIEELDWHIGLIVGPSGSGKSTVAKEFFGDCVHQGFAWPADRSILDGFPESATTTDCVAALNSVGFSSPPSWCKPFAVLSTGEKFRAEIARAMIEYADRAVFVIDEFTSVVDRVTAKIGSSAVAKAIRRRGGRMVAVSCHYDISAWLESDWVLDMKTHHFSRRRLRRPEIKIAMHHADRGLWPMFAQHHYLSGALHRASQCYCGLYGQEVVSFAAILPAMGHKGVRRVHRIVVLPEFQGVGIGRAMLRMLGDLYTSQGLRLGIVSSHPAMIRGLATDSHWSCRQFLAEGSPRNTQSCRRATERRGVSIARFEYRGRVAC